jgi:DNA-binding NarL/FixJ family response regulator
MIRVLVADDQALARGGFRMILESQRDIEVVGEAGDGVEAVRLAHQLRPDIVLMDVRMPAMDGLEATKVLLNDRGASVRILMLTTFDHDDYVYRALKAGASGFLLKDVRPEQLVDAVRTVAAGDALLAPAITRRLIAEFVRRPLADGRRSPELDQLTERELDVLRQVARGLANHEIAGALSVSEATVKTHVNHILSKLGLRDRTQAVVFAYESALVEPGIDRG